MLGGKLDAQDFRFPPSKIFPPTIQSKLPKARRKTAENFPPKKTRRKPPKIFRRESSAENFQQKSKSSAENFSSAENGKILIFARRRILKIFRRVSAQCKITSTTAFLFEYLNYNYHTDSIFVKFSKTWPKMVR